MFENTHSKRRKYCFLLNSISQAKAQMNETFEENETTLFSEEERLKWSETAGFVIEGILIPILALLGIFGMYVTIKPKTNHQDLSINFIC